MPETSYARFVFDHSMVRADGSVRWKAFLDKRPPHATSVNGHGALGTGIHWDEGALVNPLRSLLGAADLHSDSVVALDLGIHAAPTALMPHHAEIVGWPQGDDEEAKLKRIDLAIDLAASSVWVEK